MSHQEVLISFSINLKSVSATLYFLFKPISPWKCFLVTNFYSNSWNSEYHLFTCRLRLSLQKDLTEDLLHRETFNLVRERYWDSMEGGKITLVEWQMNYVNWLFDTTWKMTPLKWVKSMMSMLEDTRLLFFWKGVDCLRWVVSVANFGFTSSQAATKCYWIILIT